MWSKIKALLRSYEARTPEELDEAISKAFSKITAKDAMGYFASCGYSIIKNALALSLTPSPKRDHMLLTVLVMRGVEAAEFELDLFRRRAGEDPAAGAVFAEGVGHGGG